MQNDPPSNFLSGVPTELMNAYQHLTAENTISYQRQSVSRSEGRSKSVSDQAETNMESAEYYGLPLIPENQWDEERNHGGDEPWLGGPSIEENPRYRPTLTRIVNGVREGTIKCIIVWSLDRIWRSSTLCGLLIDLFAKHGVLLVDRNGVCDTASPDGRLKLNNNASAAQHLREMACVNSPRGTRKSREKGLCVVGSDTFGFRNIGGGRIRIVREEIELVVRVFELWAEQGWRKTHIARWLTKELKDKGMTFLMDVNDKRSIKRAPHSQNIVYLKNIDFMLRNPRYQARQPHEGQEWDCPQFLVDSETAVSVSLFVKAQERLEREKGYGNHTGEQNFLSGLVRCGFCAQPLHVAPVKQPKTGEIKRYWYTRHSDPWCWCSHNLPTVTEKQMRLYVEQTMMPLLIAEASDMLNACTERSLDDEIAIFEMGLKELGATFESRVAELFDAGGPALTAAMRVLSDRHAEQTAAAQKELDALRQRARNERSKAIDARVATEALTDWERLSEQQKQEAIRRIIRWVAVIPSQDYMDRKERRGERSPERKYTPAPPSGTVLFLSAWNTLHTAQIRRVPNPKTSTWQRIVGLVPAEPADCLGTCADMPDPAMFAAGLQRAFDGRSLKTRPEEIMPGWPPYQSETPVIDMDSEGGALDRAA